MAEEKKDPWINQMALATVILAVCATLSTFKGGAYSTQSVINQTLASDQWAYYQAKSIKRHLYELQLGQLRLQVLEPGRGRSTGEAYAKQIQAYQAEVVRYEREMRDIEAQAQEFEGRRDAATRHGQPFGMAVMFLQVAILLNSVAGLLKARRIWWASIPVGLVGIAFFADGFLTLF